MNQLDIQLILVNRIIGILLSKGRAGYTYLGVASHHPNWNKQRMGGNKWTKNRAYRHSSRRASELVIGATTDFGIDYDGQIKDWGPRLSHSWAYWAPADYTWRGNDPEVIARIVEQGGQPPEPTDHPNMAANKEAGRA